MSALPKEIVNFNQALSLPDRDICELLANIINQALTTATAKIWYGHPAWFISDNPIAGYSKQKKGIRLMFWSGADFQEEKLNILGKKFKDASIFYNDRSEIVKADLLRWLEKSKNIQWDYKNLVKRKGKLVKIQ